MAGASVRSSRSWLLVQCSPSIPFQRVRCSSLNVCAGVIVDVLILDSGRVPRAARAPGLFLQFRESLVVRLRPIY